MWVFNHVNHANHAHNKVIFLFLSGLLDCEIIVNILFLFTGQHFFAPAKKRWQRNSLPFFSQKKERKRKKLAPRFRFVRYAVIYYTISLWEHTLFYHFKRPTNNCTALSELSYLRYPTPTRLDLLNSCNVADCGNDCDIF